MHKYVLSCGPYSANGKKKESGFYADIESESERHGEKIKEERKMWSRSTVHRWMKLCGAEYKAHKQGFCDRRLDPDVQEERRQFCKTMNYLEKRMSIWSSNDKGEVHLDDNNGSHLNRQTWFAAREIEFPSKELRCSHGHGWDTCKCDKEIVPYGHDECVFWQNHDAHQWFLGPQLADSKGGHQIGIILFEFGKRREQQGETDPDLKSGYLVLAMAGRPKLTASSNPGCL